LLTVLPTIDTGVQNISASISANLIFITDGQIYLSPLLFALGFLPAVGVGCQRRLNIEPGRVASF
jgi:F-type H+-transporting ATPase subunit alpha